MPIQKIILITFRSGLVKYIPAPIHGNTLLEALEYISLNLEDIDKINIVEKINLEELRIAK